MEKIKGYNTTKQYLVGVTPPLETNTYKPVLHRELIDLTLDGIEKAGFKLDNEYYSAAREGNIANGRYTIRNVADKEMQLQIGWQNSFDKSLSLKFSIGTRIFICSNGSVHGDMGAFKKKHQGDIQQFTPKTISEYIKQAGDTFKQMQIEREEMKKVEIDMRTKATLLGRMFLEEDFIQSTQLNIIKREIECPTYNYGANNSLWELYNFVTYSMKDVHPTLYIQHHMDAHKFFNNEAGVLINVGKPVVPVDEYHISPRQTNLFEETNNRFPETLVKLED